jgi:hypothetical protein
MNLHVTVGTARILRVLVMRWTSWFSSADSMIDAVAGQTQLINCTELQQSRVRGAMRRMTNCAPFGLERRMFVSKRTLLVSVALYARCIPAGR